MSPRTALILLLLAALAIAGFLLFQPSKSPQALSQQELIERGLDLLEEQEMKANQTYWAPEIQAQKHGAIIDALWDQLNTATNKLATLADLPFSELILPLYSDPITAPHQINIFDPDPVGQKIGRDHWRARLQQAVREGWQAAQFEFRHHAFLPASNHISAQSAFFFSAHLVNSNQNQRAIVEGDLIVSWSHSLQPTPGLIDASALQVRSRVGPLPFQLAFRDDVQPPPGSYFIDPLIVGDLDRDQRPEIILAAMNRVYSRTIGGHWESRPLSTHDPGLVFTALIDDFDSDGLPDFLTARFEGLFLHQGAPGGKFPTPPILVWASQPRLQYAQALTSGDIDGDGDLDLFLGQYKVPYTDGQMPVPYFDANDGHPSFLLLNDGHGNFSDATLRSGLAAKRNRRVYSASLVDLDADRDLDLLVVSDFSGLDAWENDGRGNFRDATAKWFPTRHGFGMSHNFADFNQDGRLDILMIGMNSPTATRLDHLRLHRPYHLPDEGKRAAVTFGNRLWYGTANHQFEQTPSTWPLVRSGWSWGAAVTDFDLDSYPDIYLTTGHESRKTVRDYETEFWLHDIYLANSQENALARAWFKKKYAQTRGQGHSYGGYEKNKFYLNDRGTNFIEVAHLFGLALEQDSRNTLAEDLNDDGLPDLILTTFEVWPTQRQTLQIYESRINPPANHSPKPSPTSSWIPNGTSYRSQRLKNPPANN